MSEPFWLTIGLMIDIHAEQLAIFGGPDGLRDFGMLESALGRPQNKYAYGTQNLSALAAAYAFGIARNHPFVDGNKRAAFAAIIVFLGMNGVDFVASPASAAVMILALAADELSEDMLAVWISEQMQISVTKS